MNREIGEYDILVVLEPEVSWLDIAPFVEELQNRSGGLSIRVERAGMRPGAGGPGFDIVPIGLTLFFGPLVAELVKDVVYPFLKDKLRTIYVKVCKAERAIELKPFALGLRSGKLMATYRFPGGLSDAQFADALGSTLDHFALLQAAREGTVLLDYKPDSGSWEINEEGSAFLTEMDWRMRTPDN